MNNLILTYFLWFVVAITFLMYIHTALKNTKNVDVLFLGTSKKISMRNLMLITLLDGLVIGMIIYYLVTTSL